MKLAQGSLNFQRNCSGPTTSTDSSRGNQPTVHAPFAALRIQSTWYLMLEAVNGMPSWNFTPGRSVSNTVVGVSCTIDSASQATIGRYEPSVMNSLS